MGKIDVARVNHLGLAAGDLNRAELAIFAQALVEQRLLRLDHLRFQQQRAEIARGGDPADAARLAQHARLFRRAEVRHHARAQIDTFPDIERQRFALPVKGVDAGLIR